MTITEIIGAALAGHHAAGLPSNYDDVLSFEDATGADIETMAECPTYDYKAQRWVLGADHAHIVSNDGTAPLLFCGADVVSCLGVEL